MRWTKIDIIHTLIIHFTSSNPLYSFLVYSYNICLSSGSGVQCNRQDFVSSCTRYHLFLGASPGSLLKLPRGRGRASKGACLHPFLLQEDVQDEL